MQEFMTVTQLNRYIGSVLEGEPLLQDCWLKGEISGFKLYQQSGHIYFTLKDENSTISCVMFKSRARTLTFAPENGQEVLMRGYVSVFDRQGKYQLYVQEMQPYGIGGLLLLLEQLKKKLEAKGYFDSSVKKKLPALAHRIGIVTSQDGAALRDMVRIIRQRHQRAEIVLVHSAVQGREAPAELARAIALLNRQATVDLIIVGRGGGSFEDLMAFNSEEVVKAIFESRLPVISAVGHEVDFTLADFAADVRAATPTQAAQLAVPDLAILEQNLERHQARMIRAMQRRLLYSEESLDRILMQRIWREPGLLFKDRSDRLAAARENLIQAVLRGNKEQNSRFTQAVRSLDHLSPLKILNRGYAVVRRGNTVVASAQGIEPGSTLTVSLTDADLLVEVTGKELKQRWKI